VDLQDVDSRKVKRFVRRRLRRSFRTNLKRAVVWTPEPLVNMSPNLFLNSRQLITV
jgi:hypothetical protein